MAVQVHLNKFRLGQRFSANIFLKIKRRFSSCLQGVSFSKVTASGSWTCHKRLKSCNKSILAIFVHIGKKARVTNQGENVLSVRLRFMKI